MSLLIKQPLFATDATAPTVPASMDIGDMADFLKDDNDKTDDKIDDKLNDTKLDTGDENEEEIKIEDPDLEEETNDEEDKEDDTEDEELDEVSDDKLELVDHVSRKEILKAYPDLFKKFPYLEKAYYRNLQFTELFSKPEEAKAAIEAQQTLQNFETQLLAGDIKDVLKAVKAENQESFHKLVDNYLETLEEVDPKMWEHVVGNLNKKTVYAMYREGKQTQNKELMAAALHLNQFIFGTSEYTPPGQLSKPVEKTDKEKELEEKEKNFNQRQFETHRNSLHSRVNNSLKNTVEINIDPKGSLDNDFIKEKAVEDAMSQLYKLMNSDQKYVKGLKLLWQDAAKNDYQQPFLDKIKSYIINKSKPLLKGVIKDTRNKVFKNAANKNNNADKGSRKGPLPQGKPAAHNSGDRKVDPKSIPANMSSADYLMADD